MSLPGDTGTNPKFIGYFHAATPCAAPQGALLARKLASHPPYYRGPRSPGPWFRNLTVTIDH
jgi:hypothetical protein